MDPPRQYFPICLTRPCPTLSLQYGPLPDTICVPQCMQGIKQATSPGIRLHLQPILQGRGLSCIAVLALNDSYLISCSVLSPCPAGDSDAKLEAVVEAVDALLEQVDNTLDEMKGKKDKSSAAARKYASLRRISGVLRPQLKFNPPPDNTPVPFRVKIYKDGILTFGEPGVHYFEDQITVSTPLLSALPLLEIQRLSATRRPSCG